MLSLLRVLTIAVAAATASASDLVVKVEHHHVTRPDTTLLATVFTDEHLVVDVRLDVYAVPRVPSTKRSYDELSQLTSESWLPSVRWSLTGNDGHELELRRPTIIRATERRRGPQAGHARDRDTTVACTTFEGRVDFGLWPPGDYMLTGKVSGLSSSFPVSVRTGQEADAREMFLETQASRASTYPEFRALQLERYRTNPDRLDAIFAVIDRALLDSTLEDTEGLFALALHKMEERRRSATEPTKTQFFVDRLRELNEVQRGLPDYFAHRKDWMMVRDARGNYVTKDRKTGALVRRPLQ